MNTFNIEDKYMIPFFKKSPVSIESGKGVYVRDETGKKYIDFTSGWGVTCIGHSNPIITRALIKQSKKIIQNPESGLTYSPIRAELLKNLMQIMPAGINKIFFTNSGAESNDAAIKIARKVSGKKNIISTLMSFHGRTISTASATGQAKHREKYNPLMPNYIFVPFNDIKAVKKNISNDVAAVILEPIQGEGGVILPESGYLEELTGICKKNNVIFIADEIQTGFCRTGDYFMTSKKGIDPDIITMAKGIAGGFPFGAFGVTETISRKIEYGDHGGTYCGNPLGCSVSNAVIKYLIDNDIVNHVKKISRYTLNLLKKWREKYSDIISTVRGKGLLIAIEFFKKGLVDDIREECIKRGLFINVKHGKIIRLFPALNITKKEIETGLSILENVIDLFSS